MNPTCCACREREAVIFGRYCSECYWLFTPEALSRAYHGDRWLILQQLDAPLPRNLPISQAEELPARGPRP